VGLTGLYELVAAGGIIDISEHEGLETFLVSGLDEL